MRHYCPGSAACCVNAVCSAMISLACIVCWCDAVSLPWLLKSRATIDSSCGSVEFSRRVHAGQKHWSCSVLWLWPRPPGEQLNFPWKVRSGLCWSQPAAHYLYPPHRRHAHLAQPQHIKRSKATSSSQWPEPWPCLVPCVCSGCGT